jgi:hypothetical protein
MKPYLLLFAYAGAAALLAHTTPASLYDDGAAAQSPAPALSATVPADFSAQTQAAAVTFAWQSFVALNWPALGNQRGMPDTSKTIGQPGAVVWTTWKTPEEIFLPLAQTPAPWNQFGGSLPVECSTAGANAGDFVIWRTAKLPPTSNIPVSRSVRQVIGGTVTDQHGNLARYDVRVNKTLFDDIVAKQLYNRAVQDKARTVSLPAGVMEVKAAWREMTAADTPEIRERFFRRDAWIYTPAAPAQPATCVSGELGLVGLHITQKTPSLPQWAWATFEHVDNVPPFVPASGGSQPQPGRTLPYSFNNPACAAAQCPPNTSTEKNGQPTTTPTQVTRKVNIGAAAQSSNGSWQAALAAASPGSPFAFYQLIDAQWQVPARSQPTPFLLANTTLETYVDQSSCLNCHSTARTSGKRPSDYSFVLAEAQSPPPAARPGVRKDQR